MKVATLRKSLVTKKSCQRDSFWASERISSKSYPNISDSQAGHRIHWLDFEGHASLWRLVVLAPPITAHNSLSLLQVSRKNFENAFVNWCGCVIVVMQLSVKRGQKVKGQGRHQIRHGRKGKVIHDRTRRLLSRPRLHCVGCICT